MRCVVLCMDHVFADCMRTYMHNKHTILLCLCVRRLIFKYPRGNCVPTCARRLLCACFECCFFLCSYRTTRARIASTANTSTRETHTEGGNECNNINTRTARRHTHHNVNGGTRTCALWEMGANARQDGNTNTHTARETRARVRNVRYSV